MARVTLIVVREPGTDWALPVLDQSRQALLALGHDVEILAAADEAGGSIPDEARSSIRAIRAKADDLAGTAMAGLREATGDWLVLLEAGMSYSAQDVVAVVDRLAVGDAEIVVASRNVGPRGSIVGRLFGKAVRPVLGTTDPLTGLIGITAPLARAAEARFKPVGTRFALEILARAGGRCADVSVADRAAMAGWHSLNLGDVRQAKRLADDRFGNASRLIQFCFVGASGMVVDLTFYALFQMAFAATPMAHQSAPLVGGPLAPAAAGVVAVVLALTWNFALNRRLTFNDATRGPIARDYVRYALSNMVGNVLSLSLRLMLPNLFGFFHAHRLAAAVVGIVAATGVSFSLTRWFVFGRRPAAAVAKSEPTRLVQTSRPGGTDPRVVERSRARELTR